MSPYLVAWILWILMFFAIEIPALVERRPGDTLSAYIWRWFSIKEKSPGYRWRRLVLVIGLVWLVLHLLTGGWV